jgi:type IV secretion system protein VirB8
MSGVDEKEFNNYLKEALSWETDKVMEMNRSRKTAWRVASASGAIAFVSVLAVAALLPLKVVEPFVIRVDNATGIVDVVEALGDGKTNYDEAVNKYFTQWYVRYREGYTKELAEEYYTNVGVLSAGLEQQKYSSWFDPKNPMSPLNVYGPYAKVRVRIKSTSFIRPDVALVRYTKEVERGADRPEITHWAATVVFKYSGAPMAESDRAINPLGFQVTEYRNDPDVLPKEAAGIRTEASVVAPPSYTVFAGEQREGMPHVPAIQSEDY